MSWQVGAKHQNGLISFPHFTDAPLYKIKVGDMLFIIAERDVR
ncbi:hypothetical protein [Nostoc sp. NMS4]|nr:hypothetical protein [Nostoc sp. NMS4]